MSNVYELSQSSFRKEVLKSAMPTLVDFWAPWCAPCQMIGPVVEELATENADVIKVGKVNVDTNHDLAATYGVHSIPALLVFNGGEVTDRFVGVQRKAELEQALGLVTT